MPVETPFHSRTSARCTSLFWKEWAGCYAVRSYDVHPDAEYFALRHSVGVIDVSPLYKIEITGPDAGRLLDRVLARSASRLRVGHVRYCCWCDDRGKVLDDGTVSRLPDLDGGRRHYRVTAAEPVWGWLDRNRGELDVTIEESTERIGVLAVQGPTSRAALAQVVDADLDRLRYFRVQETKIAGHRGHISRTGYTGDLGYELWVSRDDAGAVWDAVFEAGRPHRMLPVGLDALDIARVEAGYIMNGVDYFSANHCVIEARKSTPDEIGLGWAVELDREPFIGQRAIREERQRGVVWQLVGLEFDWDAYERLFQRHGLPPEVDRQAWRSGIPVYSGKLGQVGQATSGAWSPTLKKNLAIASLRKPAWFTAGKQVRVEVTVEYQRHRIPATITKLPFFDPERKRALP